MAQLRKARVRAVVLAAVPFVLFLVTLAPRVWQPDLVPFGDRQAAYVLDARSRLPVSWATIYADLSLPTLALVEPWLRALPAPIVAWVVLRGLLDALGVALLYLAARPVVGVARGIVAAMLYAVSPTAWAAARDPAGPLGALMAAAALLGAVRLLERPTLLRGAVFGVLLGLLARSVPAGLVVVLLGAATLAAARASWRIGGVTALGLVLTAGPALFPSRGGNWIYGRTIWDAMHVPGWLVLGLAYAPFGGQAPGTTLFLDAEWWAGWLILLVAVCAVVVGLLNGHSRGQRGLVVVMLASVVGAASITFIAADRGSVVFLPTATAVLEGGALAVAVPALCLTFVLPLTVHARWVRRLAPLPIVLVLVVEAVTVGRSQLGIERRARTTPAYWLAHRTDVVVGDPVTDLGGVVGTEKSLRDWTALADAVEEVTGRLQTDEIVGDSDKALMALLGDRIVVRRMRGATVLPLARETIYLLMPGFNPPGELARPSSSQSVFTSSGATTGAHIVTLRPRSSGEWLARVQAVADGRFADGSTLLGIGDITRDGRTASFTLYWRLPVVPQGTVVAARVVVRGENELPGVRWNPLSEILPAPSNRRDGEIAVTQHRLLFEQRRYGSPLEIELQDGARSPIPTASGASSLRIPLDSGAK